MLEHPLTYPVNENDARGALFDGNPQHPLEVSQLQFQQGRGVQSRGGIDEFVRVQVDFDGAFACPCGCSLIVTGFEGLLEGALAPGIDFLLQDGRHRGQVTLVRLRLIPRHQRHEALRLHRDFKPRFVLNHHLRSGENCRDDPRAHLVEEPHPLTDLEFVCVHGTKISRGTKPYFCPPDQMTMKHFIAFALLAACTLAAAQVTEKTVVRALKELDAAFAQSIEDYHIPALGVAVVHEGQIRFAKAYGFSNTETGSRADEHTLFAVASNTKAFTAAALAQLVDDGALSWDDRVRDHLPWFTLYDPYVSEAMRVRDLLCHRTGLATFSGDLLWYGTDHSREDVLRAMRHLEPTMGFREGFGYSNLMYMAAGSVIEAVTGEPWDERVQRELLAPLGMERSVLSTVDLAGRDNVAAPHNWREGRNEPIDWVNWDNVGPAGSLISSATEMAAWMQVQLDSGRVAATGKRLWSADRTREMWTLHTPQPVSAWWNANLPSVHMRGYGLGWEVYDLEGYQIVAHSGGYDGMISRQVLVPEAELGIILLTNNNNSLPWAWGFDAISRLLGSEEPTEVVPLLLEFLREEEAHPASVLPERIENAPASLPLSAYAGTYTDRMYGDLVIAWENEELLIDFTHTELFKGTLSPWHFDTFKLTWTTKMMLPEGTATFVLDAEGRPERVEIVVENPDFDFTELKFVRN